MRDIFESEIPDTAPYKEWLGIVGSMLVAVLICAVLFAGACGGKIGGNCGASNAIFEKAGDVAFRSQQRSGPLALSRGDPRLAPPRDDQR